MCHKLLAALHVFHSYNNQQVSIISSILLKIINVGLKFKSSQEKGRAFSSQPPPNFISHTEPRARPTVPPGAERTENEETGHGQSVLLAESATLYFKVSLYFTVFQI